MVSVCRTSLTNVAQLQYEVANPRRGLTRKTMWPKPTLKLLLYMCNINCKRDYEPLVGVSQTGPLFSMMIGPFVSCSSPESSLSSRVSVS